MKSSRSKGRSGLIGTVVLCIGVVVIGLLLRRYFHIIYNVGTSNEPTVHNGQFELTDTWTYQFHAPQRGDLIGFIAPPEPSKVYQKRIIGVPGDTITINDTQVIVNGVVLNEPYVSPALQGNPNANKYESFTVPPNDYFVMGDDRRYSYDSRAWGFVPRQNIVDRGVVMLWPLAPNSGYLPNESFVYTSV